MRALEQAAIDAGEVTGLELMERAGQGVVEAIFEEWPELAETSHKAVVLCGPGNNGGDGFVVARLLKERGWEVEVFLYGDAEKLPPDARVNYERWVAVGTVSPFANGPLFAEGSWIFVDALFGIGQERDLPESVQGFAGHAIFLTELASSKMVAIDVPSGINSDTGTQLGALQIFADLTVTFHAMKPCHIDEEASKRCGKVIVKDIGLTSTGPKTLPPEA